MDEFDVEAYYREKDRRMASFGSETIEDYLARRNLVRISLVFRVFFMNCGLIDLELELLHFPRLMWTIPRPLFCNELRPPLPTIMMFYDPQRLFDIYCQGYSDVFTAIQTPRNLTPQKDTVSSIRQR